MTRAKTVLGALVLCALVLGAIGAVNASAEGLTAVTCKEVAPNGGKFNNSDCKTPEEIGSFETVAVPSGTEIEGTSTEKTPRWTGTIALVKLEITCDTGHVTGGKVVNTEEGGEHKAHFTEARIDYTNCHAKLQASGSGETCTIQQGANPEGTITTNKLTFTTSKEHKVTIKPEEGTTFVQFEILNAASPEHTCKIPKINVTIAGEVIAIANTTTHSHLTFEPATNGSNTKANGAALSYEDTIGFYMKGEPEKTVGLTTF